MQCIGLQAVNTRVLGQVHRNVPRSLRNKHDMVTTLKISMTRYGILITITVLFGRVDVVAGDLSPEQSFTVSNRSSLCLCIFHVQHRHLPVYVRWQFWQQVNAICSKGLCLYSVVILGSVDRKTWEVLHLALQKRMIVLVTACQIDLSWQIKPARDLVQYLFRQIPRIAATTQQGLRCRLGRRDTPSIFVAHLDPSRCRGSATLAMSLSVGRQTT